MEKNRDTDEGHEMGKHLARFADQAEPKARLIAPTLPPRCASCAFREGKHTANGSPATLMNAVKCWIERERFECHQPDRQGEPCSGWAMLMLADERPEAGQCDWDFIGGADRPKTIA